jgi:Vault protein inter-alpha-trypsin domain
MVCSDGRTIKGECKAKEEARDAYEQAVASGRMAGLVDYVTDDGERSSKPVCRRLNILVVFVMSVGAFPPKAVIETRLVVRSFDQTFIFCSDTAAVCLAALHW